MSRSVPLSLTPFLAVVTFACGHPDSSRVAAAASMNGPALVGTTSVVDGVTTIEFPADAFKRAAKFVVDTIPIATMGGPGASPEYDLTWARTAVVLPGGGYASLVSIGGGHLMIFDSAGRGAHIWGKLGQGPGEFTSPSGPVLLGGDTLLVPDNSNRRFNYFLPGKGLLTTVAMTPLPDGDRMLATIASPIGRLGNDRLAWYSGVLRQYDTTKISRPPIPIAISGMTNDGLHVIDSVPGFEMAPIMTHYRQRSRMGVVPLRLGQQTSFALWDTTIAFASGSHGYAIDELNVAGHLVRRIHVAVGRRPVTAAMRDVVIKVELARICPTCGEGMADPDESRREARENPFADSLPPYSRIHAGANGLLWVVDAVAPGDTATDATAFRRDGAIVGRLHISGPGTPIAFGDDRAIVRSTDDDGVVSFKVYRFHLAQ